MLLPNGADRYRAVRIVLGSPLRYNSGEPTRVEFHLRGNI